MPRGKDQKTISKRIDLHYWKKPHRLRTARRALAFVCFAGAVGWIVFATVGKGDKGQAIYNPGHVTGAHATIEHNCAACHTPDSSKPGGFNMAVNDAACIVCHEAPMHAPTQLVREGDNAGNRLALATWLKTNGLASSAQAGTAAPAEASSEGGDGAGPDDTSAETSTADVPSAAQPADAHHGMLVSAQCSACHVEHRGRDALAAVSDQHCTQCHTDLSKAMAAAKQPAIQAKVVAFNSTDHPPFGRRLPKDEQGNWLDNTKLKFNHKVHIVDQKLNDCAMCHTTWEPNLTRLRPGHDATKPPYATETDRPQAWANANDGRYMQPVSYEQSCRACHPIKVSGVKGEFAHEKIEVVRAQVYAAFQATAMTRYEKPPGAEPAGGGGRGRRGAKKDDASGPADEGEWLKGELEKLNKNITAVQKSCAKCHEMTDEKSDVASLTPASAVEFRAWLDATEAAGGVAPAVWDGQGAAVEFAAMQGRPRRRPGGSSASPPPAAAEGETPASAAASPAAKPKPRKPIKAPELQTTEPTGIPDAPRRWFVASRFDHRSHRDLSCVECHSKLDNLDKVDGVTDEKLKAELTYAATDTKAMLSPGMDWTVYRFAASGEGQWKVTTDSRSCADCHKPDSGGQRFATSSCVTCHAFHDHSKELHPDGRPHPRVTAAAVVASPAPAPAGETPAEPAPSDAPAPDDAAPTPAEETPADASAASPEAAPAEGEAAPSPESAAPAEGAPAEEPARDSATAEPADASAPPTEESAAPAEAPVEEAAPPEEPAPAEEAPAAPARKSRRPRLPGGG